MPIKVCLISLHDTTHTFGVRILSSVLRKAGHKVSIIFFKSSSHKIKVPTNEEKTELVQLLKKLDPDLVGISVTTPIFSVAVELTRHIRKLGIPVIFGGKHPTICPEDCIRYADMICVGDGEEALLELANKMDMGEDITIIENLWVKMGDEIIRNDMRWIQKDLDSLPFPDYNVEDKYYVGCTGVTSSERTIYRTMTSRGCPFNCTYCCNHVLARIYRDKGPYVRRRSVENVIQELIQAKKMFKNLQEIGFADDIFTFDRDWVEEFCGEYKRHINLRFTIIVHPDFIDMKIIHLLKDAGLVRVDVGIQSGSERIRRGIFRRYTSSKQIVRAIKMLHELNIVVSCDLIVENPYEDEDDKLETLSLLLAIRPFKLSLFPLTYFPKTDLTEKALKEGIISPSNIEGTTLHDWRIWRREPTKTWQTRTNQNFHIFWNIVFQLTQIDLLPNIIIRLFSNNKFLRRHLIFFYKLAEFIRKVERRSLILRPRRREFVRIE